MTAQLGAATGAVANLWRSDTQLVSEESDLTAEGVAAIVIIVVVVVVVVVTVQDTTKATATMTKRIGEKYP